MPSGTISIYDRVASRGEGDKRGSKEKSLAAYREKLDTAWINKKYDLEKQKAEALRAGNNKEAQKLAKQLEEEEKAQKKNTADYMAKYEAILDQQAREEALKAEKEAQDEVDHYRKNKLEKTIKEFGQKVGGVISKYTGGFLDGTKLVANVSKGINALGGSVKGYLGIYTKYMTSVNARLQGAGGQLNYEALNNKIRTNTALNPYVRYTTVLEKMASLVDQGIASNVTQRAFLASISDKIATTFDVANSSLLSIVRIQQQDSTAARLGMEAELTQLFNSYFGDTSYLSDVFDNVQSALIDVSSALGTQASVEFEYMVQKWLGALGSVGVNSGTLQTIAQGVNYLGTGDVESLAGNSSLQNLFVMAANRKNLNYSDMLSNGVNAQQVNTLLEGIVEYIQEIASNSNNVVKKQFAQLFGMTMSDMVAFKNLSSSTIEDLYDSAMTYQDTLSELNYQLGQVSGRMHLSEKIDNLFDNILASTGMRIANNLGLYSVWKSADLLESITGGINLPFISALGNGIDLNMSLEGLAKGTVVGFSAINNLVDSLTALNGDKGKLLDLDFWKFGDPEKRAGFTGYQSANQLTTKKSATNYVSSGDNLGMQQSLRDTQKETGENVNGTEETDADEMMAILRFIKSYFDDGGLESKPLKVEVSKISSSATNAVGSPFYSYTNGGLI